MFSRKLLLFKRLLALPAVVFGSLLLIAETTASPLPDPTPTPTPVDGVEAHPKIPYTERLGLEWWVMKSKFGFSRYSDETFYMRSKHRDYYYAIAATEEFSSDSKTVMVTVKNITGASTRFGYGLIFHSDPQPLKQGYAFLIDTVRQRYRVVRHVPDDEKTLSDWTLSTAIAPGKQPNTLMIRDIGKRTELYINAVRVSSVSNEFAFKGGTVGLYAGVALIGFTNLDITPGRDFP